MINIILCGGNGTRLWPLSRTLMPKQFLKLFNDKSLFQLTVERNTKVCNSQLIVSNTEQYFLAIDQLEEITTRYPLSATFLNIDIDEDILIKELAELIKKIVGFKGKLYFNTEEDETIVKLTDSNKLNSLEWKYKIELEDNIKNIYKRYL